MRYAFASAHRPKCVEQSLARYETLRVNRKIFDELAPLLERRQRDPAVYPVNEKRAKTTNSYGYPIYVHDGKPPASFPTTSVSRCESGGQRKGEPPESARANVRCAPFDIMNAYAIKLDAKAYIWLNKNLTAEKP